MAGGVLGWLAGALGGSPHNAPLKTAQSPRHPPQPLSDILPSRCNLAIFLTVVLTLFTFVIRRVFTSVYVVYICK